MATTFPPQENFNGVIDVASALGLTHVSSDMPASEGLGVFMARAAAGEIPTPPEIIEGVLHRGCKMLIGGTSKSCKSWVLLEMGLAVACGKSWWGFNTAQARVLYINFELHDWALSKRIGSLGTAMALEDRFNSDALVNFDIWNLRGHAADIAVLLPALKDKVKSGGFGLVIIDPLYKMLGNTRDENDAASMGDIFNTLEQICQTSGSALVISHHFAKGNAASKSTQDRVSGSGVMARDPDALIMLTPHDEPDTFVAEFILRNHAPVQTMCVKWVHPMLRIDGTGDPSKIKGHGGAVDRVTASDVASIVGDRLVTQNELARELQAKFRLSRSRAYDKISRLKETGVLVYTSGFLRNKEKL